MTEVKKNNFGVQIINKNVLKIRSQDSALQHFRKHGKRGN